MQATLPDIRTPGLALRIGLGLGLGLGLGSGLGVGLIVRVRVRSRVRVRVRVRAIELTGNRTPRPIVGLSAADNVFVCLCLNVIWAIEMPRYTSD